MWFQIAGVIFNFVFDPLLIFGIGPFPKMGIRGAALATVLGYALSMVIAFLLLVFTKQKVRIKIKGFHVDSHMLKNLFSYGFPSFVMNALGSFMLTFTSEPPQGEDWVQELLKMDNFIQTAHIASRSKEAEINTVNEATYQITELLK